MTYWIVLLRKHKTIKKKLNKKKKEKKKLKRAYNYHIGNFANFSFKPILLFLTL